MKNLLLDPEKLRRNLHVIRAHAKGVPIIGTLSCDAYGMGLIPAAKLLWSENVRIFAVDTARDALRLRQEGFREADILLTHSTVERAEIETLLDASAIATIGSQDAALALGGVAERRAAIAEAHIKIDTGAGQYGFLPSEVEKIASVYLNLQNIAISGVYTTLIPGAAGRTHDRQLESFQAVLDAFSRKGLETGLVHAADASALLRRPGLPCFGAVRADNALTGRLPFRTALQRVGCIATQVTEIMWLPKGAMLGGAGKTTRPARIGVIPVGYGDGFGVEPPSYGFHARFRAARRGTRRFVYVGEQKIPVVGSIGVSHIVVDLTNSNASAGAAAYLDADPLFCGSLPKEYLP